MSTVFDKEIKFLGMNKKIEVIDTERNYILPDFLLNKKEDILNQFPREKIYDNPMIRLDDYHLIDDILLLFTSKTTYFDTLVSNAIQDYPIDGVTIEERLTRNVIMSPKQSPLSNHLGCVVIMQTLDELFPMVIRGDRVVFSPNTLGLSVAGSMKRKLAVDGSGMVDTSGLRRAVEQEVCDELRLLREEFTVHFDVASSSVYLERGWNGKPQMLFNGQVLLTSTVLEKQFNERKMDEDTSSYPKSDGDELVFVAIQDLMSLCDNIETDIPTTFLGYKIDKQVVLTLLVYLKMKRLIE